MSEIASTIAYRRLRAPREDGTALFEPPVADEAAFLQQNLALREQSDCDLHGCSLRQLREQARDDLLRQATAYTRTYRDVSFGDLDRTAPVILAGHQPELVHPGVWFKNFLLSELAARTSSYAVHLLIDNDSLRSTSIRVPSGSAHSPVLSSLAMDTTAAPLPYEARSVHDTDLFASFGSRVAEAIAPLVPQPLIRQYWPAAVQSQRQHGNLGRALAEARHMLEGQWGLQTLELPLSSVCDTASFRWFAVHLFGEAARLREVHNACVAEYRRVNKVRSHTHPVPDLVAEDDWIEVPFWLWTVAQAERRPAFVRREGGHVVLSDRKDVRVVLDLAVEGDACRAVEQLHVAAQQGLRLRPRALITTMFSRMVLSDIFIHGIGGAKYDQVTDAIVRRFFEIEPPEYLVATATLKLPLTSTSVEVGDVHRLRQLIRELRYHPEMHVDESAETAPLIAEKRRWIEAELPATRLRERHQSISRINQTLYAMLASRREQLLEEQVELRTLLRKQAILESREYASCLFPIESLRDRLLDLSRQ